MTQPTVPRLAALGIAVLLAGCASKGDLRRVEDQLVLSRQESARRDSAAATRLTEILQLQRSLSDSLAQATRSFGAVSAQLQSFRGDVSNDLYNVQQQLVQVQALTGQSQQRLTELRTQLDARSEQLGASRAEPPAQGDSAARPSGPSADQMYEASLGQLRRGSPGTARMGFQQFIRTYSQDARLPDALYFIGESFAADTPDSAAAYYGQVVSGYPKSARAATSLYKLGLVAERRKDIEGAKGFYQRVTKEYPASDEAALARDRLKSLGR
jgi:tol-pal system protein YbgF